VQQTIESAKSQSRSPKFIENRHLFVNESIQRQLQWVGWRKSEIQKRKLIVKGKV